MIVCPSRSWRLKSLAGPNRAQLRDKLGPCSFMRSDTQTWHSQHSSRPCARAMSHVRQTWLGNPICHVAIEKRQMCLPNTHLTRTLTYYRAAEVSIKAVDQRNLRHRDRLWRRHLAAGHIILHQARSQVWPEPTVESPQLLCCARARPKRPGMCLGDGLGWVGHAEASPARDARSLAFTYDRRRDRAGFLLAGNRSVYVDCAPSTWSWPVLPGFPVSSSDDALYAVPLLPLRSRVLDRFSRTDVDCRLSRAP